MTSKQGRQQWRDKRLLQNFAQRFRRQQRDEIGHKIMIRGRLDHHRQLHGGGLHLDCGLRVLIESSIDDVSPIHEIGYGCGIEAKALLRDHRDKTGTRLEIRIVEFAITLVLLEVFRIGWREKCALVMIEPPCDIRRTGVLEIDYGVLLAIKLVLVEQRARPVYQAGEDEFCITANALAVKTGKQRGRRSSVETLVVIENTDSQCIPQSCRIPAPGVGLARYSLVGEKLIGLTAWSKKVKGRSWLRFLRTEERGQDQATCSR